MALKDKKDAMKDVGKVLRRKITIQKFTAYMDDMGNDIEDWLNYLTLWAEVNGLWGNEYYAAKAVNEESTIEFTLRDNANLKTLNTVDFRILFDGKTYDIKNIDHVKFEGQWVKIKALERGIGG